MSRPISTALDYKRAYHSVTLECFGKPFLGHRICDLIESHVVKVERRAKAFVSHLGSFR
jgi:hypothetical protein